MNTFNRASLEDYLSIQKKVLKELNTSLISPIPKKRTIGELNVIVIEIPTLPLTKELERGNRGNLTSILWEEREDLKFPVNLVKVSEKGLKSLSFYCSYCGRAVIERCIRELVKAAAVDTAFEWHVLKTYILRKEFMASVLEKDFVLKEAPTLMDIAREGFEGSNIREEWVNRVEQIYKEEL